TTGVNQAIRQITRTTGRKLVNERGYLIQPAQQNGVGIDHFGLVTSAGLPLRTLLAGLYEDVSLISARKALGTIYYEEVETLSLADTRDEAEQVTAVIEAKPDITFITGGTDGGAKARLMQLMDVINLGLQVSHTAQRPQIIYAGNINLREPVRQLFSNKANVHVANNVRPTLDSEQLNDAAHIVTGLYEELKIQTLPGIQELLDWSSFPVQATARTFARISQYFAALQNQRILGVDLGSNSVSFILADPAGEQISVQSDLGMGQPIQNLLDKVTPETISRWVPTEISAADTADFILNKSIHPQTIPMTGLELQLEQAAAREILRCALTKTAENWGWDFNGPQPVPPSFGLLLARGSLLANSPRPGQVMLMLLDALQPAGTFSVAVDQYGVLPALGLLASHAPEAAVQVLEAGVLSDLGWVIAPSGKGQLGKTAVKVSIETTGMEGEVEFGKIEIFPIPPGQLVEVTVQPAGKLDIGFGPGQGRQKMKIYGGIVGGLVIDARGRPLTLPSDEEERRTLMRKWLWDMGG
ncbi:MAG TPA: hypothetical protein EYH05_03490, partial [Anaerolineae bacterium]|nr:hypothetical protein [Anaerolineae bacterium]